jgi:GMP synthase (glutamine-hydrolysing)
MRIVILVTGNTIPSLRTHRGGDYDRWIRETTGDAWPGDWLSHDVRSLAPLPRSRDAAGFIITGSSSSVTERAPWMLRVEELVREIASADTPLFGICFGHQLIAQALGGDVQRNPLGREIGLMRVDRVADDPLFAGMPRAFDIHGTHVDAVVKLPPGAELLATTPRDPHAAFRVGRAVRAVQFHPEFDAHAMRGYLSTRADILRKEDIDPAASLAAVQGETRGREIMGNFARLAAAAAGGDYLVTA